MEKTFEVNKEIIVNEEVSARGTERTLAILEFLGGFRKGKSISEIARGLNLPINSVSRITDTMTLRGWLYRKEDDRRFVLTNRVAELTRPQVNDRSLTLSSWQELKNLRDRSGETTQLVVMVDGKCTILEQCISTQAIKVSGEVGMRVPCYSCAPGKSILANLPNSEFKKYTDGVTLKKFTPRTHSTIQSLSKEMQQIRESGFAVDQAEGLEGIHCVSSVILDDYNYPIGAITTIAPAFRLRKERFEEIGKACMESAEQIQNQLFD